MFKIYLTNLLLIISFTMFSQQATPLDEILNCLNSLHITKFQGNKTWKAVVGVPLTYESKPKIKNPDPNLKWNWEIGEGSCSIFTPFWTLASLNGDFEREKTRGLNITNMPSSNEDFGDKNGLVKVSNSINNIRNEESCEDRNGNEAKVKVFFEKDAMNNPDGTVPNWFYYWSQNQIIQNELEIPGIKLFDKDNCVWNNSVTPLKLNIEYSHQPIYNPTPGIQNSYGSNSFNVLNMDKRNLTQICGAVNPEMVVVDYEPYYSKITINNPSGYQKELSDGTILKGIHAFFSIVIHEVEHALIECEVWADGYSSLLDQDGDGYNDAWEMQKAIQHFPEFQFDVRPNDMTPPYDAYGVNPLTNKPMQYDDRLLGQGLYSVGTEYEEWRCRKKERDSKHLHININQYDWSYDPTNTHQGKQW
jgi:hypothetical protein